MTMAMYEALPTYLGGKRKLVGRIFKRLPPPAEAPVFADPFMGGGSVSLTAKARGYRVLCNDIAERSFAVGQGLIENGHVTLAEHDLLRIFAAQDDTPTFARSHLAPDVVTETHAGFLDQVIGLARATPGTKGSLLLLLAVKYLLGQRPMGNFGAKSIVRQMAEGDWDVVNPAYLKDAVSRMVLRHPLEVARHLAGKINGGVFETGQRHEASQGDALDFLRGVRADIAYLDSPYGSTTSYEVALRPLDELLAGQPLTPTKSRFSGPEALSALAEVIDACSHIPVLAVSYGGPTTDLDQLSAMVGKGRGRVHAEAVRYSHLAALASAENKASNQELLVVGWA